MPTFRLKQIMNVAKVVRDIKMHTLCKSALVHGLHNLFYNDNPTYDAQKFINISKGITNTKDMENFLKQRKIIL